LNGLIDEMQFAWIRDSEDLPGKIAVKRADFGYDAAVRQTFEKNRSGWQHGAIAEVMNTKWGRRLYQTSAPKGLICYLLKLDIILELPGHPGTQRPHLTKPLGAKAGEPLLTILHTGISIAR
jgi:hypothetical protein